LPLSFPSIEIGFRSNKSDPEDTLGVLGEEEEEEEKEEEKETMTEAGRDIN